MNRASNAIQRLIPNVPSHLASRVRVEQVDTLANLGGAIGLVGVFAAFGIFAAFWHSASHVYLVGFLATFITIYAAAFRRSLIWRRQSNRKEMSHGAYRVRNLHVGLIGLLWSTMPVSLAPHADSNQILLIVYVSSGLIASSVVIAPTLLAAFAISIPVMSGTLIAMLMSRGEAGPMLAGLVIVYSSLIFVSTIHSHRVFIQRTVGRMELEEQRELVGLLLRDFEQESSDWLWQTDAAHRLNRISDRMIQALGIPESDLRGQEFTHFVSSLTDDETATSAALTHLRQSFVKQDAFRDLRLAIKLQDRHFWWSITGKPVFEKDGAFKGYRGVGSDVTAAEESRLQIAHMASHDSLTGLPNRAFFRDALTSAYRSSSGQFALLWADLDGFKSVNDTLGHPTGDALLIAVATRLRACVRSEDIVARLGGDEFAILLHDVNRCEADELAKRVIDSISAPYHVNEMRLSIGVSLGLSLAPSDAKKPDDLLKNADLALYKAKTEGRGTWRFYEVAMLESAQERGALQNDLRLALEREEFSLVFQPIMNLDSGCVSSAEALLRWTHPEQGNVPPDRFIKLAEETGLIISIGEWVLHRACREAAHWPGQACVAVNLSPVQFRDTSLLRTIDAALTESGLPASRLILEITESIFLAEDETVLATLHHLRKRGVSVALDDFGTGYSSLSYLRSFPFDKVKIDKSFIRDIATDGDALAIVRAIIGMAKSLGMIVVAEGVETDAQLALVRSEGCTRVQGYLYSRPLGCKDIRLYITRLAVDSGLGVEPTSTLITATGTT
ncbi:putative bifunctional diguanylate cyclase/phosphodiesterase [Caballeronia sp. DA-9]|uniref:putative bifunctional diguanylate cyclase/phosphodiesterase n=1 Tax=Caballeronia sp. DA-9 TaxID=3436237 RepID=UPI003F67B3FE